MLTDILSQSEADAIRKRLIVIRTLVAGSNQAEFARRLDIQRPRWANLEAGFPITLEIVFRITKCADLSGMTTNYILEGRFDGMPSTLKRKLQAKEAELFPSSPSTTRKVAGKNI
jgi:hypothetical protein